MGFFIVILVLIGIMYYIFNYTKDDNSIHIDYDIIYDNINRINILFKINYEVIK